jgi:hypothetical protein
MNLGKQYSVRFTTDDDMDSITFLEKFTSLGEKAEFIRQAVRNEIKRRKVENKQSNGGN